MRAGDYYPGEPRAEDYRQPLRYLAIRVKNKQGRAKQRYASPLARVTLRLSER